MENNFKLTPNDFKLNIYEQIKISKIFYEICEYRGVDPCMTLAMHIRMYMVYDVTKSALDLLANEEKFARCAVKK